MITKSTQSKLIGTWGYRADFQPGRKLSSLDVLRIRQWATDHPEQSVRAISRQLAPYYDVCRTTIADIVTRESWKYLPEETLVRL